MYDKRVCEKGYVLLVSSESISHPGVRVVHPLQAAESRVGVALPQHPIQHRQRFRLCQIRPKLSQSEPQICQF